MPIDIVQTGNGGLPPGNAVSAKCIDETEQLRVQALLGRARGAIDDLHRDREALRPDRCESPDCVLALSQSSRQDIDRHRGIRAPLQSAENGGLLISQAEI